MELPEAIPDWVSESPPAEALVPPCACCWADEESRVSSGTPSVSPEVAAVEAAVARLVAVDPAALPGSQALADAEALLRVAQRLRVHELVRVGDARQRELFVLSGFRSTSSWLRAFAPDSDPSLARLSERLAGLPILAASVRAGDCSLRAARLVVAAVQRCRPHVDTGTGLIDEQPAEQVITAVLGHVVPMVAGCLGVREEDDPRLGGLQRRIESLGGGELDRLAGAFTVLAEQVPPALLPGCLEDLVLAVVPSLLEERGERGRERAGLSLEPRPDGTGWRLEADLDLECGERLFTALAAEARRDEGNPADTAAAQQLREQGLDPYDPDRALADHRTGEQTGWPRGRRRRLHDALSLLLDRYLTAGLGGVSQKVPVQVSVTVQAGVLEGRPGALPAVGDSGARLPRRLLQHWWGDARVLAFVLNQAGTALRVVHAGRTLTAVERRAALIEARGVCAGDGCCRGRPEPGRDLRPHHVRRWADDGRTSLDDTVMICDVLHRDLHEGGRTVRLRDGRRLNEHGWVAG